MGSNHESPDPESGVVPVIPSQRAHGESRTRNIQFRKLETRPPRHALVVEDQRFELCMFQHVRLALSQSSLSSVPDIIPDKVSGMP